MQIKSSASRELELVGTKKDRQRIVSRIHGLANDPRPANSEKLAAKKTSIVSGKVITALFTPSMTSGGWLF
jgi:hypothetical protein